MIGKKNMVFGFFYFLTTLGLGMYLANKLGANDPQWTDSQIRATLRAAHAHGNLESLLNIVIGYLLCRLSLDTWLAKTASILLIIGAVFHSGMLYLGGLGVTAAFNLTPVGAISLVATMLLMGIGILKLKSVD
jgi:uncharacterized membrane protein YgdD (TMEM256/DUF423 family)